MPQVNAPDLATIAAQLRQIERTAQALLDLIEPRQPAGRDPDDDRDAGPAAETPEPATGPPAAVR